MEGGRLRYEAGVAPDGRVLRLIEWAPDGGSREIPPGSPEGLAILADGGEILYAFDEERRLKNLPYSEVLEAMGQEIRLTLHKVRHGELQDEPEMVPILRRLLADIEATAAAFREAWGGGRTAT
ncbi:MAG TPA: hypothetical protein VLT62_12160 [Candidatus Methylomirabilis sp.]|nr:hypothetical protein [Candidatus Methylomirabilis sp.]